MSSEDISGLCKIAHVSCHIFGVLHMEYAPGRWWDISSLVRSRKSWCIPVLLNAFQNWLHIQELFFNYRHPLICPRDWIELNRLNRTVFLL